MEREVQKIVAQVLSMGKEPDANPHPLLMQTDTAHSVENFKKLNFEVLEHPFYSLDLTPSDSYVLVHLNKAYESFGLPRTSNWV
jgi:hypothetical protein